MPASHCGSPIALSRNDRARPPTVILRGERCTAARPRLEHFVQQAFFAAYGAHVREFSPLLVGFQGNGGLQAVAGLRDAGVVPLFSEQYLDEPIEALLARQGGVAVERHRIVEVGNLALDEPGHARWLIGAVTLMLHAAGYHHVVFTAVRPLVNAFARLGLSPVVFGEADRSRLPESGRRWGRYYEARPVVCAGDVGAGWRHLQQRIAASSPEWSRFWGRAAAAGVALRPPGTRTLAVAL